MFDVKDIANIKGYKTITSNQEIFRGFLQNFINSWGVEARQTLKPLSIKFCKDGSVSYLKFEYEIYNRKEWLHVNSVDNWY